MEWDNIEYLQEGDHVQRKAYAILTKLRIMEHLKAFRPILVGTIPIGIYTKTSDLDVICQTLDLEMFQELIKDKFQALTAFRIEYSNEVVVSNFYYKGMEIELYASKKEPKLQNGYRHMVIEQRILRLGNKTFKNKVIELKKTGLKTEPAFAQLLGLTGNPYEQLLLLEGWEDDQIQERLKRRKNESKIN